MSDKEIIVSPAQFHAPKALMVEHGLTIGQIIERMDAPVWAGAYIVEIDGVPVSRDRWNIVPDIDTHVLIYAPVHGGGGGGKSPLRTLLTIAVIVAAVWIAPQLGAYLAKAGIVTAGTAANGLAFSLVMTAGMLLVNAIAPVRPPQISRTSHSYEDSPTYSISGGSNQENPWGAVPVNLGKNKAYPPLGAKSYTEIVGGDEYLRMLFIWGYGPQKIEELKIGETLLTSFEGVEIQTREGWADDEPITLFPSQVYQDSIGVELTSAGGIVSRTARANVDEFSVDVSFPRGLVQYANDGSRTSRSVSVKIQYREVGSGTWIDVETHTFSDMTTSAVRYGTRWTVDNTKAYEIGLTRVTADTDDDKVIDDVYWTNLRSIVTDNPIDFPHPVAATAVRIKASDQLQGMVDTFNGMVTSYAPVWNSGSEEWGDDTAEYEATNNPAALLRHVLMHPANARARAAAQVDNDTLGEWYEFCEANGYAFNMYRDYTASVWETCADIASTGRASPNIKDGLWSVTADTGEQTLVQHITPRNSWGFSAEKTLYHRPHAFRIRFMDEGNGYQYDERIVYDDGYDENNATFFESIEFPGITDPDLIWKFGRFHIAQARLRPETYSLHMDFEHLVCRRGDKVRVSHDVPLWGSGWGRVKSLTEDSGNITHITLDESVVMQVGKSYACRFRLSDGETLVLSVVTSPGETATLELQTSVPITSAPEEGDLAMFGEAESETVELLVRSVARASDYTAHLLLVDIAEEIYDADTGEIPPFDPQTTAPVNITKVAPAAPLIIGTEAGTAALEISGSGVLSRILVYLSPSVGNTRVDRYRVRYRLQGETQWQYTSDTDSLTVPVFPVTDLARYEIQAQAISVYGVPSLWTASKTVLVTGQSELPADVTGFNCNIVGTIAHLSWSPVSDIDLSHYRIKWSPALSGASWSEGVNVVERVGKPATSVTVPALIGTYLIKAVDYKGNESETAGVTITNIARVAALNYVEEICLPPWIGAGDGATYMESIGGVTLDSGNDLYNLTDLYMVGELYVNGSLVNEGTYEIDEIVDLEGVFTSRLSANLEISGQDLLSDLYLVANLYDSLDLYEVQEGSYSAGLEVRTTEDDPNGAPDWTDWQTFMVGDYTARAFQFRLRLVGTPPGVTPIVSAVAVEIDMEDRVIGFNSTIPIGGARVSFSPAFYAVPEIGLSVSDGQEGDKYTITNKNETGFDISFTNLGSGVERSISGIARSYGSLEV